MRGGVGDVGRRRRRIVGAGQGRGGPTGYKVGIPPVGSGCAGNKSLPHMDHAAAAVTIPAKAADSQSLDLRRRQVGTLPARVFWT